jgi:nicotinamidase/pyrazinamidase
MSTLFIDVDTQLDFLYPAGALYVPGAETLIPTLAHLTRYAAHHGIPLVSTVDAHTQNDPEVQAWRRVVVPNREGALAIDGAPQIVVEKQTVDAFQTHTFARIVQHLNPDRFVVYGVVTEICVLHAVRGLLRLRKPVTVVTDAIRSLSAQASQNALDEMRAAGAVLATAGQVAP